MRTNDMAQVTKAGGRILVVDDEEKNRRLLTDVLSVDGYTVETASDGLQALQRVPMFRPEAILLDVMMPQLDGVETCRRLKLDPATASVPVLLVTALHDRADRLKGIQAGADDFLTKPLDMEEVRLRVRNAVHAKRLYDQASEAHEQLLKLEQFRDNLTQFIVHDLRSPLAVIMGNLELLNLKYLGPLNDRQQKGAGIAYSVSQQLLEMISSLLDVARMENDQMPLRLEPCDVQSLVQEVLATLTPLLGSARVCVDMPPVLPPVICDAALIRRVLGNLLGNAIKVVWSGGRITVRATIDGRNPGFVEVSVSDTGPGIPPEYHEKIFEKFGQVDPQSRKARYSTGLGLTFCKMAVETHGGRIGVESPSTLFRAGASALPAPPSEDSGEAEGPGSTFWFTLPARQEATTREAISA